MKTLYDLLGVRPDADDATIRAAFRKAAKAYHPDANAGDRTVEQRFMEITAAHAILRDPDRRATYDRALERRRQKLLREWRITLMGWGLSAVLSAGVVSAGALLVPKWLAKSNFAGTAFTSRFFAFDGKPSDKAVAPTATPSTTAMATAAATTSTAATTATVAASTTTPTAASTATAAATTTTPAAAGGEATPKPAAEPPPTSGHMALEGGEQHQARPENATSPGDDHAMQTRADANHETAKADGRAAGEPERSAAKSGSTVLRSAGADRRREARVEAFLFGDDRLGDSLMRTHIFDREEVEQILGFAEATGEPPIDECLPERGHRSAKHHHHHDRRTASRHFHSL